MSETVVVTDESVTVVSVGTQGPPGAGAQAAGNVLAVSVDGSDLTGARERLDKPFATLGAARTAALSGDTVIVYPGTYSVTTDISGGTVKWLLFPGASMTAGVGGTLPQYLSVVDLNSVALGVVLAGRAASLLNVGQVLSKQGVVPMISAGGITPRVGDLVIQAAENGSGIQPGSVLITGGDADDTVGGDVHIVGGGSVAGPYTCGAVFINDVEFGPIIVGALPTADPHVVGQLWNSTGTLKVSAG